MKKLFPLFPVLAFFAFASCNELKVSEDDDTDDSDGGANAVFALTGFSIAENAVVDDLKPSITVTFNKTLDAASVTGSAVTLDSGGVAVAVGITVSGQNAVVVPRLRFSVTDPDDSVYVSAAGSVSDSGLSPDHPVNTIVAGPSIADAKNLSSVRVAGGTHPITETISMIGGISLPGGYSADFASRDFTANETKISSSTLGNLVSVSDAALTNADVLEGFTIENSEYTTTTAHSIAVACSGTTANSMRAYGISRSDAPAVDTSLAVKGNIILVTNTGTSGTVGPFGIYLQGISAASEVVIRNRGLRERDNRHRRRRPPGGFLRPRGRRETVSTGKEAAHSGISTSTPSNLLNPLSKVTTAFPVAAARAAKEASVPVMCLFGKSC